MLVLTVTITIHKGLFVVVLLCAAVLYVNGDYKNQKRFVFVVLLFAVVSAVALTIKQGCSLLY